jgi:hypothetical protein
MLTRDGDVRVHGRGPGLVKSRGSLRVETRCSYFVASPGGYVIAHVNVNEERIMRGFEPDDTVNIILISNFLRSTLQSQYSISNVVQD